MNYFLSFLCLLFTQVSSAASTAELLGFAPTDRILIIHADDIGMSHTVNRAAREVFQAGLVKSGSVMTPCPWTSEVQALLRENPHLDLGIHATLTSEWKYLKWAPLSLAPTLRNPAGFFWPTLLDVFNHATAQDVIQELEQQILQAKQLGIVPTHLDSHMGVHFARPDYLRGTIGLAKKYFMSTLLVRWSSDFEKEVNKYKLDGKSIREITEESEKDGFLPLDYLYTGVPGKTVAERYESYTHLLSSLKPGVTQLIIHPGFLDDEMKGIMVEAPEGLYRREADRLFFSDPQTKKLIEKLGIKLIGWREMEHLRKTRR